MTCRDVREHLVDLFDSTVPPETERELQAHLASCEECAHEYAGIRAAVAAIEPPRHVQASPDFKERVMNNLMTPDAPAKVRRVFIPRFVVIGAAALLLVALAPFFSSSLLKRGQTPAPVLSLLAESVQAMSGLQSVHLSARMRTTPAENFEYINPDCDWVPLEIWKQFSDPPRWRVEKPGRVVVMDGVSSLLFMKPDHADHGSPQTNYLGWLKPLLDTDKVMANELRMAKSGASIARLHEESRNGAHQLVMAVSHTAQGDFSNDWLRNKTVSSSDHTRVYRFDAATKRLEGMEVVLHARSENVVVFEVTGIRYNEPLDLTLFSIELPTNVNWGVSPEQMPVSGALPQSPREAAVLLFEALAREDWEQARVVLPQSRVSQNIKEIFGGLHVVSVGEAFQSGLYPGWFVPYEIKLKSGAVRKHNLAVRNDNAARRWVWDGGL